MTASGVKGLAVGTTTGQGESDLIWVGAGSNCVLRQVAPTPAPINVQPSPMITGVTPGSGQEGSMVPVLINGSNFGSSAASVSISGITGTVNSVNSAGTQIGATFNLSTLTAGTASFKVSVRTTDGGSVSSNTWPFTVNPVSVTTAEVTVIGWINANTITLPGGENSKLQTALNTIGSCTVLLGLWANGTATDITNQSDINYANAWLLKHSGNAAPPATISPTTQLDGGDFRVFNDYQVSLFESQGIISSANSIKATVEVGSTPDPCGSGTHVAGQNHPNNGAQGLTASATGIYELVEGRVGTIGQAVSFTLNNRTVPWVWNVIEFNALGNPTTTNVSMFPTFSVYQNGVLTATYPQGSITAFIALDDTYQRLPSQIQ